MVLQNYIYLDYQDNWKINDKNNAIKFCFHIVYSWDNEDDKSLMFRNQNTLIARCFTEAKLNNAGIGTISVHMARCLKINQVSNTRWRRIRFFLYNSCSKTGIYMLQNLDKI